MENGDLVIKYKSEQDLDKELDHKIEECLKKQGYKWVGSGFSFHENIRDIQFIKK